MRDKILTICGPTGTGKTALAVKLAKKFNGEIVSADSRQVYKGMDTGTGKDLPVNSKLKTQNPKLNFKSKNLTIGYYEIDGIRVWLYDVVGPDYQFNVADYVKCANLVIKDIWRRGKLPVLVGGTGLYIKAVVEGIETLGVRPDWKLRKHLSNLPIEQLRKKLEELDPKRLGRMNESDRNNPRRLIRAIEIAQNLKWQISNVKTKSQMSGLDTLFIGLKAPYKILYKRIDKRVDKRVNKGIEEEIKRLVKNGYNFENSVLGTTIGYKEWLPYLAAKASKEEVIQKWKYNEHGYARRQMTWFKKQKNIIWFDISQKKYKIEIEKIVTQWYHKN